MDFVLYIKAWTIGYKIDEKLEDISYLISLSCWYKEDVEDSEETIYPTQDSFVSINGSIPDTDSTQAN